MISEEHEQNILDYIGAHGTKAEPVLKGVLERGLGMKNIAELNTMLKHLVEQGRVIRVMHLGQDAFYPRPEHDPPGPKSEVRVPVPKPEEYVEAEQEAPVTAGPMDKPWPSDEEAERRDAEFDARIIELRAKPGMTNHMIAKELGVSYTKVQGRIVNLIRSKQLQPKMPGHKVGGASRGFRAPCGRSFTYSKNFRNHEDRCAKCKALKKVEEKAGKGSESAMKAPTEQEIILSPAEIYVRTGSEETSKPKAIFVIEPAYGSQVTVGADALQKWIECLFAHGIKELIITKEAP